MRYLLALLAALSISLVSFAGCGDDQSASTPTSLVPAGSAVYGEVTLKPEGEQKQAVESLIEKFPGAEDAQTRVKALLEKLFEEQGEGLSYSQDVEPWLGDKAAFFVSRVEARDESDGAALVATEDEGKTEDAIEKATHGKGRAASYRDHDYTLTRGDAAGVVDGWLVVGSRAGFKAVVDTVEDGSTIEDDERYRRAIDGIDDNRLGFLYLDMEEVLAGTPGAAMFADQLKGAFKDPYVATFDADEDGAEFEADMPESLGTLFPFLGRGSELVGQLPADSWLALGQPDLGKTIEGFVDLFARAAGGRDAIEQQLRAATGLDLDRDVLSWMGDFGVFVRGTSVDDLNGALVVETTDESASARFIGRLRTLLRRQGEARIGPLTAPGGGKGFTIHAADTPAPVHIFQRDGRVVLAYGNDAAADALDPAQKLADSSDFEAAADSLGGGYLVSFYLAAAPIIDLVESTGAASDPDWQDVKPYLEPLVALIGGASGEGDALRSAFKVIVK
jgi:hypothetical protein